MHPEPLPPGDPSEEVSTLIEALHENVQRLEELTAGEVDTVADRHGRPFLLRHAQETLRASEAAKQAAILNALPAHIALLDAQGFIISVNEAWRRFAGENVFVGAAQGVGLNYLGICDGARGNDAMQAGPVAAGIRSVLSGAAKSFSIEYPCDSPTEQRWFLLTVTPLAEDRANGAVVMHLNITQQKRDEEGIVELRRLAEEELTDGKNAAVSRENAQRYDFLADSVPLMLWTARPDGYVDYYNKAWFDYTDLTHAQTEGDGWVATVLHPDDQQLTLERWRHSVTTGERYEMEYRFKRAADATFRWFLGRASARRNTAGEIVQWVGTCMDIEDRKRAESELKRIHSELECRVAERTRELQQANHTLQAEISERGRAKEALRSSESRLRAIIENEPECVKTVSVDGRLMEMNPAGLRMIEADDGAQVFGRAVIELVHPADRAAFLQVHQAVSRGGTGKAQFRIIGLKGAQRWMDTHSVPLRASDGSITDVLSVTRDITERKQSEQDLRESERRFSDMLGNVELLSLMLDTNARITYCNDFLLHLTGWRREEVIGRDWSGLFIPPGIDFGKDVFPALLADLPEARHRETEILTRSGGRRLIRWSNSVLRSGVGDVVGAASIGEDITEQLKSRESLLQNEARTRSIVESALDAVVVMDAAGCITDWNAQAEKTFGWPRGEVIGKSLAETIVPPRYRKTHDRGFRAFLETGEGPILNRRLELAAMHRAGHEFPVELTISPVRLGGAWIFSSFIRDLTENRKNEEEVRATRNFLASIFDNIPNSIFVKDARDLQFVRVNAACEKLTGYAEEEFLGKNDYDFFPREQADAFVAKDRETLAGKHEVFIFEETITSKDGTQKILQTKKFPVLDKDGRPQYLLGMSEDITERKRSEHLLRESDAKFRHLIEQADDGIFLCDMLGNYTLVNSRACELLGYTEDELLCKNSDITYLEEERQIHAQRLKTLTAATILRFERLVKRRNGTTFPAEIALKMVGQGTIQGIFHDITTRRAQEQKIFRLSRIQAVVSGINAAIVRIRDRRELFHEACRIIVEHGHFTFGWIAVLDQATGNLSAAAHAGLPENSADVRAFFNGSVELVPAGTAEVALREKRAAIDNVIEDAPGSVDPELQPGTLIVRRAAIALGAKSVIVLPLIVERLTFGILTLYAPERNFFDDEEVKLLNDLAGDISFGLEFIAKEEKVDYLAYYDALTGLANRRLFLERLAQYMRGALSSGHKLALFFIDLERFRNINDSLGRAAGDALLKQVSDWLSGNVGDPTLLARLGGDHFAIVLPKLKQEGNVASLIEKRIRAFLEHSFRLNETEFRIPIKVGVALFPDDGSDADTLLQNAEAALKKAKASGERYLFYTQKMTDTVAGKLTLENQLRQAVDNEEFVLHYQPKVNLDSGKLTGAEALIRWNDPRTGQVPPARFIPILEESGLIYEVGRWALRKAIEDYLRWRTAGLAAVRIAVNVSPLQLRNRGFVDEIKQAIGIDTRAADGLELEITESLIMEDVKHSIASLKAIRALGVSIAIDDFGTGFSSLSYLAKLPVDTLKIDRSFVIDMTASQEGLALVSTIINLAHSLKLKVVAEGVETGEQSRLLRLLNCDDMQGYLFSKPVPYENFESSFLMSPSGDGSRTNGGKR